MIYLNLTLPNESLIAFRNCRTILIVSVYFMSSWMYDALNVFVNNGNSAIRKHRSLKDTQTVISLSGVFISSLEVRLGLPIMAPAYKKLRNYNSTYLRWFF